MLHIARTTLLAGLVPGFLAPAAAAQTLQWSITSESVRVSPQSFVHTEHARPFALRPLAGAPLTSAEGRASSTVTIDWSFTATNNESNAVTFTPALVRSDVFITEGTCWGVDPTPPAPFTVLSNAPLDAGETRVFSGTEVIDFDVQINIDGCSGFDGLHTTLGSSNVFAGPDSFTFWANFAGNDVDIVDGGTTFTNEVTIRTDYELPLLDGPGACLPLVPNSTGATSQLEAFGVADVNDGLVVLAATDLPPNQFALVALSATVQGATPLSGFGQATLCLGAPQFRWLESIQVTDPSGAFFAEVTPATMPVPGGAITAGSSWAFQLYHRDVVGGAASANSTNSVVVGF